MLIQGSGQNSLYGITNMTYKKNLGQWCILSLDENIAKLKKMVLFSEISWIKMYGSNVRSVWKLRKIKKMFRNNYATIWRFLKKKTNNKQQETLRALKYFENITEANN